MNEQIEQLIPRVRDTDIVRVLLEITQAEEAVCITKLRLTYSANDKVDFPREQFSEREKIRKYIMQKNCALIRASLVDGNGNELVFVQRHPDEAEDTLAISPKGEFASVVQSRFHNELHPPLWDILLSMFLFAAIVMFVLAIPIGVVTGFLFRAEGNDQQAAIIHGFTVAGVVAFVSYLPIAYFDWQNYVAKVKQKKE